MLGTGGSGKIDVAFAGKAVGKAAEKVTLLIDNGFVHEFTLTATCEVPKIRLAGLAGGFRAAPSLDLSMGSAPRRFRPVGFAAPSLVYPARNRTGRRPATEVII